MKRKYRSRSKKSSPVEAFFLFCVLALIWWFVKQGKPITDPEFIRYLLTFCSVFLLTSFVIVFILYKKRKAKIQALTLAGIDTMTGTQFEYYLKDLLISRGHKNVLVTDEKGDYGADLLTDDVPSLAIQAKRYATHNLVGVEALYQVLGGMKYYGKSSGMVITSSYFTFQAKILSARSEVTLIDRTTLAEWIQEFQNK